MAQNLDSKVRARSTSTGLSRPTAARRVTNAVGLSTSVLPAGSQITSDIGQSGEGLNTIEQQPLVAPTRRAFLFEGPLPREVLMIGLVD